MNKNSIFLIVAVLLLVVIGAWWALSRQEAPAPAEDLGQVEGTTEEAFVDDSKDGAAEGVTIRYTAAGFVPSAVTVKKGTRVTFVNETAEEMWVASDEHPSHTQYAGTNKDEHCLDGQPSATAFDQCGTSLSYVFAFEKTGVWSYHNHREDEDRGTVTVTE